MDFQALIVLGHHLLRLLLSFLSLKYSFILLRKQNRLNKTTKFSPLLKMYFVGILIFSLISLVNVVYLIAFWRPVENLYNAYLLFWMGFFPFLVGYVGTVLEIFLCFERCLSIVFPFKLFSSRFHLYFGYLSLIGLAAFTYGFLEFSTILVMAPRTPITNCTVFGCMLIGLPKASLFPPKITCLITNAIGGILLWILIKIYLKTGQTNQRKMGKTLLIIIASCTFFEIAPNIISSLFNTVFFCFLKKLYQRNFFS